MTDTEYEGIRDRIRVVADKWLGPLGLKWWSVKIDYDRDGDDFKDLEVAAGFCTAARTRCQWAYMEGTLVLNMPMLLEKTDEELEKIFVHECMHLFLHETRAGTRCECDWDIRHEERVATTLQKAFLWTWEMAYEAGQKSVAASKEIPAHVVEASQVRLNGQEGVGRVSIPIPG